jgi:hypothetical protein
MKTVKAKWYVILKGKKGYLKNRERDRRWSGFNFVVNPKRESGKYYTFKEMVDTVTAAKRHGVKLKVLKRVDVIETGDSKRKPRDLKQRALSKRRDFLNTIRNRMRDLVEYEKRLVRAKKELEAYSKRLETVNNTLKPLMGHGEKGYSEPKFETSN